MSVHVPLFKASDDSKESFNSYMERLYAYFMAMKIGQCDQDAEAAAADKQKVVHLISCIGKRTYST